MPTNQKPESNNQSEMHHTNALIHESSPYLLQHAHNPVNWYPWGEEAWNKAKSENKPVLISIGYSACHWCHVMEHESFEDDSTAELMNEYFVCIKVDREERPDIDQVYMSAVQLISGNGGWPLNCFTLPDGKPIYGGTYFPYASWKNVLRQLHTLYKNEPDKARQYAEELTHGIHQVDVIRPVHENEEFSKEILHRTISRWKKLLDQKEGGPNRAPKFPLPNNYEFLLRYAVTEQDEELNQHVQLTLKKMAYGGIYDQIGGGFARYSVDSIWKVPHFEKMLYDNAQLVSLYSKAYQQSGNSLYRDIVRQTLAWIEHEMTSEEGGFYSALDADSEGEEGKYYVWNKTELELLLGDDYPLIAAYYNVEGKGLWEHGNAILVRNEDDKTIADKFSISLNVLQQKIIHAQEILLKARAKRIRPGLDDKQLTSWNALMITAYCDAYNAFGDETYLNAAIKNASHLLKRVRQKDGGLMHSYKNGKAKINAYLEDYAFIAEAFIALYGSTFDPEWLQEANSIAEYTLQHFYDQASGLFWFTSNLDPVLIARKKEINDNVIPASNSSMAKALYALGVHLEKPEYIAISKKMIHTVSKDMEQYGSGYSNWATLLMNFVYPVNEVVITGTQAESMRKELMKKYLPNVLFAGCSTENNTLPLLTQRFVKDKTLLYVCRNKTCQLPVSTIPEVLQQLNHRD